MKKPKAKQYMRECVVKNLWKKCQKYNKGVALNSKWAIILIENQSAIQNYMKKFRFKQQQIHINKTIHNNNNINSTINKNRCVFVLIALLFRIIYKSSCLEFELFASGRRFPVDNCLFQCTPHWSALAWTLCDVLLEIANRWRMTFVCIVKVGESEKWFGVSDRIISGCAHGCSRYVRIDKQCCWQAVNLFVIHSQWWLVRI